RRSRSYELISGEHVAALAMSEPNGERKTRKGQNRIKTRQKREARRSREKFKAVAVGRARKSEQNAKRMAENANAVKSYSSFKKKEEKRGQKCNYLKVSDTGANADNCPKLYG
nr:isovaleryl-CoA dehydrogenase, mitochondrial isoform X2 [Tanacetum cinerariifolium]